MVSSLSLHKPLHGGKQDASPRHRNEIMHITLQVASIINWTQLNNLYIRVAQDICVICCVHMGIAQALVEQLMATILGLTARFHRFQAALHLALRSFSSWLLMNCFFGF